MSKSQTQQFWESPDQLLVLALSVTDLCWLQPIHVQHSQVFCLLQAFQNEDNFQQILDHLEALCHPFICTALVASSPKVFWIIQIVSTEECSGLTQNLMWILCSTRSIILNVTVTQYTCSLNDIYHPHWLVQWSHHCSPMHIPVHPPWLPGRIDVTQTILLILTMAGLFSRQNIYIWRRPIVPRAKQ